ncbi:sugar ABC transporter ATP-binding protein [Evansella halocellulosilytica]|uniref:sugar ABC transporter ATP-binding protein n=1 Tax=Evansella halocellulosilytica TaxID=2011013 RepID=UPI00211C2E0C|nr:sugar ABC transporter ATP-binding protein [Evansella halocellulosilytica]
MDYLLEMRNISKTFPGVKALNDVELLIKPGEVHALIGENGAGKSTLIKILAGVHQPDDGAEFKLEGKAANIEKPIDATSKGISIIYQDLSLFPNLTVAENISIGKDQGKSILHRINWNHIKKTASNALKEVGIDIDLNTPVERLSIAKQQMVAIARAIAFDSKLIVMDEPTSSLSSSEIDILYRIIDKLKSQGISIIFVSHKLNELFRVSDRFTVLRDGNYIGTYKSEEMTEDKLISLMVGREIRIEKYERNPIGEPILAVENLSKEGNFKDVSFTLHKGEVIGITGLVGSGRTELVQSLFGLNIPDKGEILLESKKYWPKTSEKALKLGLAYVPENRQKEGVVLSQSIIDNVTITNLKHLKNRLKLIDKKKEKALTDEYMETYDVRPRISTMLAEQLSGGNQQKVVLAKWMAINPKILIIDEPTNGIDVGAKSEIHKLLRTLAKEGMGIIMVSSELPEVLNVSDRILVMRHGRIHGEFDAETATQEMIMGVAFKGKNGEEVKETENESLQKH